MSELISPIKAIRAKCLDCCCGSVQEVRDCHITECPLYAFRFGKNPYRKPISDERREKYRQQALINFSKKKDEGK